MSLTERERSQIEEYLRDPLRFPPEFKAWLIKYLETELWKPPRNDVLWEDVGGDAIGPVQARVMQVKVVSETMNVVTGNGQVIFTVPPELDGMNLVGVGAYVSTAASSGQTTVQVRNATSGSDMLSTRIRIDVGEKTSYTAATPPVINSSNAGVATGDLIAIDVDVAGIDAKGLGVVFSFA